MMMMYNFTTKVQINPQTVQKAHKDPSHSNLLEDQFSYGNKSISHWNYFSIITLLIMILLLHIFINISKMIRAINHNFRTTYFYSLISLPSSVKF